MIGGESLWLFLGVAVALTAFAFFRGKARRQRSGARRPAHRAAGLRRDRFRDNPADSNRGPGATDSGASDGGGD